MNSLEFVESRIKFFGEKIKEEEQEFKIMKTEDKHIIHYYKNHIDILKEKKEIYEQIKTVLEAWEETKKYLVLNEGFLPFYESTYEYITLKNDCIDESNSEEEGISISKIKKALEVE